MVRSSRGVSLRYADSWLEHGFALSEDLGYPELAHLLRRRGRLEGGANRTQMRELFRRMVFNILLDNTDDHEKNHVVLVDDAQTYELSPAFDVLPSGQALGYQQMRVGAEQADSTLVNALSMCSAFGLKTDEAAREVRLVIGVVDRWKAHFRSCGVSAHDIDSLAEQIRVPRTRGFPPSTPGFETIHSLMTSSLASSRWRQRRRVGCDAPSYLAAR